MTYSSGGLIQASDYNGFTTSSGGLNDIWSTGSGDKGWGQTAISSVAAGGTVTAAQWATLVNTLSSAGSQTNTTLTSRSAPTAGTVISILANVATDITNVTTNRGNAAAIGAAVGTFTGSVSKTTATGSGQTAWTITWTQTVTFGSADEARYFWNAGGTVRLAMGKSSTGTDVDADWNTFVGKVGTLFITGRVNGANQQISGGTYTGFTRSGGSDVNVTINTNASTTGWYSLVSGAAATTLFKMTNAVAPYTGEYIQVTAAVNAGRTVLTLVTTWVSDGSSGAGTTADISGGTATTSPATNVAGTAPTVLCNYYPPATTYLTSTWGTPTIASSVV